MTCHAACARGGLEPPTHDEVVRIWDQYQRWVQDGKPADYPLALIVAVPCLYARIVWLETLLREAASTMSRRCRTSSG